MKCTLPMNWRKLFRNIALVFSSIIVTSTLALSTFVMVRYQSLSNPEVVKSPEVKYSKFLDTNGNVVKELGNYEENYIEYEDIPKTLIDALLAIEDVSYYSHDGFDSRRILASLVNNILSDKVQGASTITQQLAKNLFLSPKKTLSRKVDELLLAIKLESKFSKEEILEFYFNMVFFDPVEPGVMRGAKKYFDKSAQALSLPECALLVGLVKSPTYYNPLKYPDKAKKRQVVVLNAMLKYGYITSLEYEHALNTPIEDLVITKEQYEETYQYQAYLDCCYKEVKRLTGIDPYVTPLIVETYMDPAIQGFVDSLSDGTNYTFKDDIQQFALSLVDNEKGAVIALSGGRNYVGEKLYNRAYDMKRGIASTIKPVFEYALAIEHLGYNAITTLKDEYMTYPSGEVVHNAGGSYSGIMTLQDALGYSKNTTAIATLIKLQNRFGSEFLSDYLKRINLLDSGPFTLSYGLGGMKEGVSPIALSGAYAMLANGGIYKEPALIKRVIDINDNREIYRHESQQVRVLSSESAYMVTDLLKTMVEHDYVGLSKVKVKDCVVAAKTGTGAYDSIVANKYGYPSGVDKDSWLAGYTPDYSLAVWSGFDLPLVNEKAYFGKGDARRNVPKELFKKVMEKVALSHTSFSKPENIKRVPLVKYADGYYLPNAYIPKNYVMETYVKGDEAFETYPLPVFEKVEPVVFFYEDKVQFYLPPLTAQDELYKRIYGPLGYHIEIEEDGVKSVTFIEGENYEYRTSNPAKLKYTIKVGYQNLTSLYGDSITNFDESFFTPW